MKIHHLFVASLFALLTTGCIKEDLSECYKDNVIIYFEYKADGETDVLSKYMDKVDLYVFDESNHILGKGEYNKEQLVNFEAVPSFKLEPGRYKVVAVGNAYDMTEVVNVTSTDFNDIYIQHPYWGDESQAVTSHDDNYMGQTEIIVPDNEFLRDTVELFSSHIDVSVEIYGLPSAGGRAMPYELSFENSNAQTSFNNEINVAEKGTCYPQLVYDAENNCYRTDDLALFRMDEDGELAEHFCEHVLVLKNTETGEELVRQDMYDYIVSNAIDVTKQEALLPIEIRYSSVGVSVKVPDWAIEDIKPEY